MSDDLVLALNDAAGFRSDGDAGLMAAAAAEIARLRKLDAELGRVESAIIMADDKFDANSDHANCGDRLIASVQRLREERDRLRAALYDATAHMGAACAALTVKKTSHMWVTEFARATERARAALKGGDDA